MKEKSRLQQMQKQLKTTIDGERYFHTLGVMYTSAALAMVYEVDLETAQIAGLLHDCAKCLTNEERLAICKEQNIAISEAELQNPFLLHAKVGAYLARANYEVDNEAICNAIAYHTTGKPEMSLLEKIVFVADYIEPARDRAKNLTFYRKIAFENIDLCVYHILKDTLEYLEDKGGVIDKMTSISYEYYKELVCH